jgi:hypothetical protein
MSLIPITATVVYAAASALGMARLPVAAVVFFVLTGPAGTLLFVASTVKILCHRAPVTTKAASPAAL